MWKRTEWISALKLSDETGGFRAPTDHGRGGVHGVRGRMTCEELAAGGRHVIRYDLRDTGRSVTYEPGAPGYSLDDLADDAVGVLDAYEIRRAHLAGCRWAG